MIILGIETSCDETAAAVLEVKRGKFTLRSNVVYSQIKIHRQTGGVVPEVAARNHVIKVIPVLKEALTSAKVKPKDIDYIAVTHKPGLITSLLVGIETAKVLSYAWRKPLIAVDHLKGHLYANWLTENARHIKFPALGLIVSGGHTEIVYMKDRFSFKNIGQTLDDAVGEAFDKVGKTLGLAYPGGPEIAKRATKGNPQAFNFPRPMIDSGDFNFSYSGLKTSVLYAVNKLKQPFSDKIINDICASFQAAAVEILVTKTKLAAAKYNIKAVIVGGGVAANNELRSKLKKAIPNVNLILPEKKLTTDNAAMIAAAGYFKVLKKDFTPWQKIKAEPN
ncbi:MAG: tRNA (adenosine(37)-N6)-threonylcarbamoyltransferase complex transferase subunit TsaD [Candidatus Buchananbacteria bacterium CG10_big_fil_rev_8_21_14_0_10_42_9]|uniref:tRNA N6-adenosine threonylcarbamoyltransferase n=1 Tax=Candidatus Buchananbacteria bacterium CG10_big_fil_rev_8_21_14_0_10_42_9 TaxID=1974526 RepID=A0A2H0W343_9BACT|nr:MAG: tRNA (adenosine(37)-N6)-threonylcarbamoyltransferase complex transferase subunit TsaD [Candidatus Buchananbacteria bacterium CG10_big_fil_rev_8_21_14_0_10_42_9]